jgi:hypothetical protein
MNRFGYVWRAVRQAAAVAGASGILCDACAIGQSENPIHGARRGREKLSVPADRAEH